MKYEVFISYRRSDTTKSAIILQQKLESHFTTFLDKEGIGIGENWADQIENALKDSLAVLMVIGENWDEQRLFEENDWVLKEFNFAKNEKKRIIPIFIDAAKVPSSANLPESIQELFKKQGLRVKVDRPSDLTYLIKNIQSLKLENYYGKEVVQFVEHSRGRYDPKSILSKKSEVIICKARDNKLERDVVLRVYKDNRKSESLKKTLFSALEFAKVIPHSVQIFDADYNKYPHIVLDFMDGGSLRTSIDTDLGSPSEIVANQVIQIGKALSDVKTWHCNIKPTNVLLGKDNKNLYLNPLNRITTINKEKLKCDCTKILEFEELQTSNTNEDLAYRAPEIFKTDLDERTIQNSEEQIDQYQLGLLGIELLTGKMPCTFISIEELDKPPSEKEIRGRTAAYLDKTEGKLQRIFYKMTEPQVGKRYPNLSTAIEEVSESTLKLKDTDLVRKSYLRCLKTTVEERGFLQAFYEEFVKDKQVRKKFKKFEDKKAMNSQYNHLQGALFGLIEYAALIAAGENMDDIKFLEYVARKHGRGDNKSKKQKYFINISESHLYWFKHVLKEIVCGKDDSGHGAFDRDCLISKTDREIIKVAWGKVLDPGIDYFRRIIRKSNS